MFEKRVVLLILDGWGISTPGPGNAITQAQTPNMDSLWVSYPHTTLEASGESVGLPRGEPGNTETGHINLGAGRIVYQDLQRINMSIAEGTFFNNATLNQVIDHALKFGSKLHIMGLIGAGGVHSNLEHLYALIQLAGKRKITNVYLHLFTDGRDSPPMSAKIYLNKIQEVIAREKVGVIATIMGRYWSMDRDFRWDRTEKAYLAMTQAVGTKYVDPQEVISLSYQKGLTDEFIEPSIIVSSEGKPLATVGDNDSVIFFNFRIDRPRQLSRAFVVRDWQNVATMQWDYDPYSVKYYQKHVKDLPQTRMPFNRGKRLENLFFVTMTEYDKFLGQNGAVVAFPPEMVDYPLGNIISQYDLRQLRVSESEKERFVTIYFNGLVEQPFRGEERVIVPSPSVATYDRVPEMSVREVTATALSKMSQNFYSFVIINFANPDMVGHTGNIGAAVTACGVVDECLGKISNYILAYGGTLLITADHGNAEEMINPHTGIIDTEHNSNPVPFIAVSKNFIGNHTTLPSGILADVAPTVLKLMGLPQPGAMTGKNLLSF